MQRLTGLDATFLYLETPTSHMHVASCAVFDPSTVEDYSFDGVKQLVADRLHLLPPFRRRLVTVPFQLHHPLWIEDPDFDLDYHVRRAALPSPGGTEELAEFAAEVMGRPLDRSKPLWELWVLTGLEGGRIAYYNRVHHACLDGVSGQAAVQAIMDETPDPRVVEAPPSSFWDTPARSSAMDLLSGALENLVKYQLRQATRTFDHADTVRRLWQRSIDPSRGLGAMTEGAPVTRFNRMVGSRRSYAVGELPLADVRSIGKAVGATLNDVFLAVCSGGLRSYLSRRGELPEKSLVAGCPVSLRKAGDTSLNNQVTMMLVSFASDEPDPVKRLLKIAESSRQAKGVTADLAASYDSDVALPWLPGLMGMAAGLSEAARLPELVPPAVLCNLVVSNVPGPRQQLYALGAKMLTHYPVSIPVHMQAANITVQSYLDQLFFGITACAEALPDPAVLRDDMLTAFAEIRGRVLKAPAVFAPREPAASGRLLQSGPRPSESQAA